MEHPQNSFLNSTGDALSNDDPILPSIFVQIPMAYQPSSCSGSAIKAEESIKSEVLEMGQRKAQSPFLLGNEDMVTARVKPLKVHKCKQCPFLTTSPANLTSHCESHRETPLLEEVSWLTCPGCANTFRAKKSLEVHLVHDHQVLEAELEALVEFATMSSQTKSPPSSNRSTPKSRPSRIFIKSVDVLRNPVEESFLQNRIFLRNPDLEQVVSEILQPMEQLCDSVSEFPSIEQNNPGIVVTEAQTFGLPGMFSNDCTPSPIDLDRGDLIVITPTSVHSNTADHSDTAVQDEPGRIYLRNADTMKTLSGVENVQNSAFLHLRTVDELNLMNLEDVQNINQQTNDNSKHSCDEVVILDDAQISSSLFSVAAAGEESAENRESTLTATVQDMMVNYVMTDKDTSRIDDGNSFKNFLSSTNVADTENQSSDFGNFQALENIIEATNYYSPAKIVSFEEASGAFNQQPCFCVPEDSFQGVLAEEREHPTHLYQTPVIPIDDNNAEINTPTHSVRIPSPEVSEQEDTKALGRIYVVKNLHETPSSAKEKKPRRVAKNIGRPRGARKSGITELRKLYSNITSDEIGTKCDNEDCAIRFRNLTNLSYHRQCHTSDCHGIICPECKSTDFRNWNTLHTHLWREHQIDMELYSCEVCNFKTPVLSRLKNTHVKIHSEDRNFKCDTCEKRFKNTKQLKNHRRIHRSAPEQVQVRKCDFCPATLVTGRQYKKHLRAEHACASGRNTCSVCGKVMNSVASLKIHERKHANSGQFACTECSYTTHDHNAARRHRMKHSQDKQYKCPFCGYKSIQSTTYRNHLVKMHPAQADELIFKCTKCTFETINYTKHRLHIAKHEVAEEKASGEKCAIDEIDQDILEIFSDATEPSVTPPLSTVPSPRHNKIKVKSNLVLRDPSKFINTNNLLLQNLQPHQMLPTPPADQHLPLIRPALFSKTFDGDGVKQLKLTDRLPPCASPQYPNIDLT